MKSFDKSKSEEAPNQEIQDYLDLLLSPTKDIINQAVDVAQMATLQSDQAGDLYNDNPPSRAIITDTYSKSLSKRELKTETSMERPQFSSAPKRQEQNHPVKPFADPVKPLTLKMPLPSVQTATPEKPSEAKTPDTGVEEVLAPAFLAPDIPEPLAQPEDAVIEAAAILSAEQTHKTTLWMENGRPSWAQERFECLLFSVGGLTLAVPLVELGSIYPVSDELTPIFGQIGWFMGLLSIKGINIRTVNTAKVVMPERYEQSMGENFNYVISINGVDWGLAVDSVSNAITLEPEDVRWRSGRNKRPWLAGTVVDHMCALLDVSQLANMFLEQDKNRL